MDLEANHSVERRTHVSVTTNPSSHSSSNNNDEVVVQVATVTLGAAPAGKQLEDDDDHSTRFCSQFPFLVCTTGCIAVISMVCFGLSVLFFVLVGLPQSKETNVSPLAQIGDYVVMDHIMAVPVSRVNSKRSQASNKDLQDYWKALYHRLHDDKTTPLLPDSAPARALEWLAAHDPLHLDPTSPRLLQRYALAVLYYSYSSSWTVPPDGGWCAAVEYADINGTVVALKAAQNEAEKPYHDDYYSLEDHADATAKTTTEAQRVFVPVHECDWLGIKCDDFGRITALRFSSRSFVLTGTLPTELGLLTSLQVLDVSRNKLRDGAFATDTLKRWTALRELDVGWNAFTTVPRDIGLLGDSLEVLRLDRNELEGSIPVELLSQLSHLTIFGASHNPGLYGNIWQDLVAEHWPALQEINVVHTALSGTIPQVVKGGTLSQLQLLYARDSGLSGSLPATLHHATNLQEIAVGGSVDRMIPIPFPEEWGYSLTNLEGLFLQQSNAVTGTIPSSIGRLTSLKVVMLAGVGLHGTLPTEVGELRHLVAWDVRDNPKLTGTIPTELGNCHRLRNLKLEQTGLMGNMPEQVCALESVLAVSAECGQVTCPVGCCPSCG